MGKRQAKKIGEITDYEMKKAVENIFFPDGIQNQGWGQAGAVHVRYLRSRRVFEIEVDYSRGLKFYHLEEISKIANTTNIDIGISSEFNSGSDLTPVDSYRHFLTVTLRPLSDEVETTRKEVQTTDGKNWQVEESFYTVTQTTTREKITILRTTKKEKKTDG